MGGGGGRPKEAQLETQIVVRSLTVPGIELPIEVVLVHAARRLHLVVPRVLRHLRVAEPAGHARLRLLEAPVVRPGRPGGAGGAEEAAEEGGGGEADHVADGCC